MKEKGETDKEPYDNEPTILIGNLEGHIYRRKYLYQSTMIGTNARLDGAMPETVIQPPTPKIILGPRSHPTHYSLGGLNQKGY